MSADVSCNLERSMCPMMTPFASEDTLHLKEVSGNLFGGVAFYRNVFAAQKTKRYFCKKGNFYEEILLISHFLMKKTRKNMKHRSLLAFRSIKNVS